uniref:SPARC-like 1 n=1 Tax=Paramormyrops kingsleyae TaxID=1676925 RepID=A0A3B3SGD8_9TELE|nr:SPARC-like protein 1 isoform X1 [Paramormyrops kingsleyae]
MGGGGGDKKGCRLPLPQTARRPITGTKFPLPSGARESGAFWVMKTCPTIPCLLALASLASVWSQPPNRPSISLKSLLMLQDMEPPGMDEDILPTFIAFEASSQEQEGEDVSYDAPEVANREDGTYLTGGQGEDRTELVLLRKVVLTRLLGEKEREGPLGRPRGVKEDMDVAQGGNSESEAEIPTDLDYDGDSQDYMEGLGSEETSETGAMPLAEGPNFLSSEEVQDRDPAANREFPEGNMDISPGGAQEATDRTSWEGNTSLELGGAWRTAVWDSAEISKDKVRKRKGERPIRKGLDQQNGAHVTKEAEKDPETTDGMPHKSAETSGRWASPRVRNPTQAQKARRPDASSGPSGDEAQRLAAADLCDAFPCKRGKTCQLDRGGHPGCVCQDPLTCTPSASEFEHVCGTDNKTYDSTCLFFATKCNLKGTKRGHRLHLDYAGPCKHIASCHDGELAQVPLRMRDWLKKILLQLYEHDMHIPGFLSAKQQLRVQKIFESERRLHTGEHSIKMLARDFEKNYRGYIYLVHWQFAQMDKHPTDRLLCHTELAQLRALLVPMEHCTSRFFRECDRDKDGLVSFKEWGRCLGIRDADMDTNLLM